MKNLILAFLILLFGSCSKQNNRLNDIEPIYVEPILISDSVMTNFPGSLLLVGDYLIWEDPFNYSAFLKVVDIRTGKQVAQVGQIGQGPKEFVTPSVHLLSADKVGVTDMNTNKRAVFEIEKLLNKQEPFTYYKKNGLKGATIYREIEENKFVGLFPEEQFLFKVIEQNRSISFGKFPINEHLDKRNRFNNFQGILAYNPENKRLIYCPFRFPYIISYKRSGERFVHHKTLKIFDAKYNFVNGELKFNERITLIGEMSITKDYIVVARPKEFKKDIDRFTGSQKRPQTLYLYDYELNLQKIVDLKVPIYRLAGNENSNSVYAIVSNPEYSIVEVDLSFDNE